MCFCLLGLRERFARRQPCRSQRDIHARTDRSAPRWERHHGSILHLARRLECPSSALALRAPRSEEHTSELQSLMRISYAVFCLKKKTHLHTYHLSTPSLHCHSHIFDLTLLISMLRQHQRYRPTNTH